MKGEDWREKRKESRDVVEGNKERQKARKTRRKLREEKRVYRGNKIGTCSTVT
jgi:hypothetical protein